PVNLFALGVLERTVLESLPEILEFIRVRQLIPRSRGRIVQFLKMFLLDGIKLQRGAHNHDSPKWGKTPIVRAIASPRQSRLTIREFSSTSPICGIPIATAMGNGHRPSSIWANPTRGWPA